MKNEHPTESAIPGKFCILHALLAVLLLLIAPPATLAQSLTLADPHWNITLSDFGYSDFLLDNTPGFEGRENLSGEWGAAIGYELPGGIVEASR